MSKQQFAHAGSKIVFMANTISKTCAASFFERSFLYAAPTLWNKLSIDIRMLEFNQFKSRVKTELYLKYFEPYQCVIVLLTISDIVFLSL